MKLKADTLQHKLRTFSEQYKRKCVKQIPFAMMARWWHRMVDEYTIFHWKAEFCSPRSLVPKWKHIITKSMAYARPLSAFTIATVAIFTVNIIFHLIQWPSCHSHAISFHPWRIFLKLSCFWSTPHVIIHFNLNTRHCVCMSVSVSACELTKKSKGCYINGMHPEIPRSRWYSVRATATETQTLLEIAILHYSAKPVNAGRKFQSKSWVDSNFPEHTYPGNSSLIERDILLAQASLAGDTMKPIQGM